MSAYDNDTRVTAKNADSTSFDVFLGVGSTGRVWLSRTGQWVASEWAGHAEYHASDDEAIRSLIGGPE